MNHTSQDSISDERRSAPRHRVFKGATITLGQTTADCTVRNISDRGAAIDVIDKIAIPQSFVLIIPADQTYRKCQLVWAAGRRVGVSFY
jgi:hypothetical protein